jgi:spore cortex formation protein SpoVR/YcgB (stage V sporulation)
MTSNLNNAAVMSIDDYFTKNLYRGKIYKTTNMLGKTLSQYCPNDTAMTKEQKRIESEIKAFEENIWGDKAVKDSLDSVAKLQKVDKKSVKKSRRSNSGSSVRNRRKSDGGSSSSGTAARVTVRRERH